MSGQIRILRTVTVALLASTLVAVLGLLLLLAEGEAWRCTAPKEWFDGVSRITRTGHEYVGYWVIKPSGDIRLIPFYDNHKGVYLNIRPPGACVWPVGMAGYPEAPGGFEIVWVGIPEYVGE